ncbi:MAG: hypothetical protein IJ237_12000 [Oscillospiraceae bacterium]|nr:hypothetical protein [Oscillospiraceae bacterium]
MNDYAKDAWKYYEYGRLYNNNLIPNQYTMVNTNTEFFNGNQWIHMPDTPAMRRLAKPTFNIIKRVTSLFVASLTSSNTTISFEPLSSRTDGEAAAFATAEVRNLLEKFKMDYRIRDALFDGAITGDYAAHFYWNPEARPYGGAFGEYKGEIEMELLDGVNVMFGNPNCRDVEKQPYILIVGRDTVENLKREAEWWRRKTAAAGNTSPTAQGMADAHACAVPPPHEGRVEIVADSDLYNFAGVGGKTELHGDDEKTGKALYVYLYTKVWKTEQYINPKTGMTEIRKVQTVHVTKATRHCNIFEDIDTGLSRYPLAWGNWQKQRNQYHGRALVTEIIPNQIFINQMMAMVFRHLQTQAFPTKIYNADLIPNISNEVGTAIGVRNLQPGQQIGEVISTIPAANMSNQIIQAIDLCMAYTKECLGATDAQMGSVRPDNTSALMVLQNASEVPLENTRAGLHEWVEDIGAILLDMMGTYYGSRPVVIDHSMREFDFSVFKHLWLNMSVDVGATTYYSEIAAVQTLDNLRRDGTLSVIEYLERMPDKLITRKQELIESLKKQMGEPPAAAGNTSSTVAGATVPLPSQGTRPMAVAEGKVLRGGESDAHIIGSELDAAKKLARLPTSMQARYNDLPGTAQRALLK